MIDRKTQVGLTVVAIVAVYLVGFLLTMSFFGDVKDIFYVLIAYIALTMFAVITLAMVGAFAHNIYQFATTRQRAPQEATAET